MTPSLVLRFAARDWRAGELRLLLAALLLAVGAVSAISLFVDRLQRALVAESTSFLGADRVIDSSREIPERFRELARQRNLELADLVTFPSMVFAVGSDERSQLASVKAVASGYPLRGVLRIAAEPFDDGQVTDQVPERGQVWLDSRLFPALGLNVGDRISVGYAEFAVGGVLSSEPDRGGSFFEFAPRLLMRIEDVPATRVVQPGSRIDYRLLLAGDDKQLASLREAIARGSGPQLPLAQHPRRQRLHRPRPGTSRELPPARRPAGRAAGRHRRGARRQPLRPGATSITSGC